MLALMKIDPGARDLTLPKNDETNLGRVHYS